MKALGIAIKLTFTGKNQFIYAQTWLFAAVVVICCLTQLNYLNKVIVICMFENSFYEYNEAYKVDFDYSKSNDFNSHVVLTSEHYLAIPVSFLKNNN